ncbi:hypothetical protein [Clostridium sp. Marseille-P299]|uniref:hypothetical protein n=1 Tax=Clostridium sp. Marseille-P299 TaxID=1805477 RepID=UPI0008357D12|nr:hypothetical protein [Clostridium sp. Marseille-P299]
MRDKHRIRKISKGNLIAVLLSSVVVASIIGRIGWNKLKIDEPIYFRYLVEHYLPTIPDSVVETSTLQLIYVQNITDEREVTEVSFINHPELIVSVLNKDITNHGIYKISNATLFLEWDQNAINELPESIETNNIQVKYSDDSSQIIDIGKICIYSGMSEQELLEAVNSVPLWELERVQTYKANDTLMIDGLSEISKEFLSKADIIKSYSLIGDNNDMTDVSGAVKLEKYEELEFNMQLKDFDRTRLIDLNSNYDYYQLRPKLVFHKESGESYFTEIHNPPISIKFKNYGDVRNYVKRRISN